MLRASVRGGGDGETLAGGRGKRGRERKDARRGWRRIDDDDAIRYVSGVNTLLDARDELGDAEERRGRDHRAAGAGAEAAAAAAARVL